MMFMNRLRELASRHWAPLAAAAIAAVVVAARVGSHGSPLPEVSVEEVAVLLGRPGVQVIDANATEVFEAAHLPGAIHVNALRLAASDLPADRATTLVFYCKNPH